MRVECKISPEHTEPYAVLYINRMTEAAARIIAVLERESTEPPAIIAARDKGAYFISPEDISLVRTEGRAVVCYDKQGNRYVLDKPLYELEELLGTAFVRISKSAIVNISGIDHVKASFNGTMELVMKNGLTDYISRSFRRDFKERLGLK